MENSFNILFLSDAHLGNPRHGFDPKEVLLPLIADIRLMRGRLGIPQLIIFGGDLVFGDLPQSPIVTQFQLAKNFIDDVYNALDASPVLTPLLLVPGNHDVNRNLVGNDQDIWVSGLNDPNVLDQEIMKHSILWRRFLERQEAWKDFYSTILPNQWAFNDQLYLTTGEMDFNGVLIGIAGINSSWSCSAKDNKGSIWIGNHQYQTAINRLRDCDFKIGVWHHPLSWLHPSEEHQLRQHVQHDFNLFLHGHEHSQFSNEAKNHLDLASGACYQGSKFKNAYSWISINFEQGDAEVAFRTYSDEGKRGWVPFVVPGLSESPPGTAIFNGLFQPIKKAAVTSKAPAANEVAATRQIKDFQELCSELKTLLDQNHTFFNAFGPNSSANAEGDVRLDLSLWDNAKKEVIIPNNKKIAELLNGYKSLLPPDSSVCVQKMVTHIYAFEKHCENPKISYNDHRFPSCFPEMVANGLVSDADQPFFSEMSDWLSGRLQAEASITQAYIFGSAVQTATKARDVDVAVAHNIKVSEQVLALGARLDFLNKEFISQFNKTLHFTIFNASEAKSISDFMRIAGVHDQIL